MPNNIADKYKSYIIVNNIGENNLYAFMTTRLEGEEDKLIEWNEEILGPIPTLEQIEAAHVQWTLLDKAQENKAAAKQLLIDTDWSQYPDVSNTSLTPHLSNVSEFGVYRNQIRAIFTNPTAEVTWPTVPTASWSS